MLLRLTIILKPALFDSRIDQRFSYKVTVKSSFEAYTRINTRFRTIQIPGSNDNEHNLKDYIFERDNLVLNKLVFTVSTTDNNDKLTV